MKKTKSLFQQLHEANEKIAEQKKDIKECLNCLDKINISLWDEKIQSVINLYNQKYK